MARKILVIDDDVSLRRVMEFNLQEAGYDVSTASDGAEGLRLFKRLRPEMVITDVQMPGISGYEVLKQLMELEPRTLVIIVTAFSTVEQAVAAMKDGAYDYLAKPFGRDQLTMTVAKAFEFKKLSQENRQLKEELAGKTGPKNMVAEAPAMRKLMERIGKVAASDASVMISGESGTGKEVVARRLHMGSARKGEAFIAVNCAAIPKDLIESELFGHVKGSFTGAVNDRKGKFSLANGGTLFLDEIGELPVELQPKLLRALQEQQIEPVGGLSEQVDVRVLAATNRDLEAAMEQGLFREDLYYRLAVVPIEIPPLRERREDIPLLLQASLTKQSQHSGVTFSDDLISCLKNYDWPGNVRELENVVEQMLILRTGNQLEIADLPTRIGRPRNRNESVLHLPDGGYSLEKLEREAVVEALKRCNGNKSKAAEFLKIPRHTFLYRLEKYNIEVP